MTFDVNQNESKMANDKKNENGGDSECGKAGTHYLSGPDVQETLSHKLETEIAKHSCENQTTRS